MRSELAVALVAALGHPVRLDLVVPLVQQVRAGLKDQQGQAEVRLELQDQQDLAALLVQADLQGQLAQRT